MKIKENYKVRLNYEMTLKNGTMVDKSPDVEPFEFVTGREEVIPCLEEGVLGMEPGESRTMEAPPEKAFGQRDPDAVITVRKEELDNRIGAIEEGMVLRIRDEDGNRMIVTVAAVDDDTVTMDLNHPLAGEEIILKVDVLEADRAPLDA